MTKKIIIFTILLSMFLLSNCRTMMINQTAETLKPKQKESTFYTGIGAGINTFTPSLKFQFGYQQRFGLSENIEFQFFLYNDLDLSATIFLSNTLKLSPKFRVYHNDKYHLSLLPCVGLYNIQYGFYAIEYLGPYTGVTLISSHNVKENKFSIYYGLGVELGENILHTISYSGSNVVYQNRLECMLLDLSLGTSLGFEVLKNNIVTRHEISLTSSFDLERNTLYNNINLNHLLFSIVYGFSVGGRYQKIE